MIYSIELPHELAAQSHELTAQSHKLTARSQRNPLELVAVGILYLVATFTLHGAMELP